MSRSRKYITRFWIIIRQNDVWKIITFFYNERRIHTSWRRIHIGGSDAVLRGVFLEIKYRFHFLFIIQWGIWANPLVYNEFP